MCTSTGRLARTLVALSGVLLALSHVSGARAFDLKRTPSGHIVHWSVDSVTFGVNEPARGTISRDELDRALDIALDTWRGMPGVPWLRTCRRGEACNAQVWVDVPAASEWRFDRDRLAVTVATMDDSTGEMMQADVVVNSRFPSCLMDEAHPDPGQYDLASTLAHEVGHVLGLAESEVRTATMWPRGGRGDTSARTLDDDDERALETLHAATAPEPELFPGCAVAMIREPAGRRPVAPLLVVLAMVCTAYMRRRCYVGRRRRTAHSGG